MRDIRHFRGYAVTRASDKILPPQRGRGNMKKLWLLAGILILGVVVLWLFVGRQRHPDTSSVASFAPYTEIRGDITPTWSPDDEEVIYCNGREEEQKLYSVSANGGTPRPFPSTQSDDCGFSSRGRLACCAQATSGRRAPAAVISSRSPFRGPVSPRTWTPLGLPTGRRLRLRRSLSDAS